MKKLYSLISAIAFLSFFSVVASAQCSFNASTINTCRTTPIIFTITSTPGSAARFDWDFFDGTPTYTTTISTTTVSHTFTGTGNYNVSLKVYDGGGANICSANQNIYTYGLSGVSVPDSLCPGSQGSMCANSNQGGGYSTFWKFGDGTTSNSNYECTSHTYTAQTTYTITVIAAPSGCPTDSAKKAVVIHPNATPNANWWFNNGGQNLYCPNQPINFNTDAAATYTWAFGDGSFSNAQSPAHTYTTVNTYSITVSKTNVCGKTASYTNTVTISNTVPFPNQSWFKINSSNISCPNTELNFDAPDGYLTYQWNFGDGSPLETNIDKWTNHMYGSTLTTYTISVKITNGCGMDTTLYTPLQITNSAYFPNNNFDLYVDNPNCILNPVKLSARGGYVKYVWQFGDGKSATTTKDRANHTYTLTGSYNASVTITNGCGNDTTLTAQVVVDNTGSFPNGNNIQIEANPSNGKSCPNDIVAFRINVENYSSYQWDFNDGNTITTSGNEIQHSYTATGTYNVSCKITNGCGLFTTVYTTFDVTNTAPISPSLYVVSIQNPACIGDKVFMIPQQGQSTYQYIWNFGDGGKDTTIGVGTTHVFATIGNHTVTVQVKNGCGITGNISFVDTIKSNAFPSLYQSTGDPIYGIPGGEGTGVFTAGCVGDAIIFYFMGETPNNVWNFGDGSSGTATEHMVVAGGDGSNYPVTIIKHAYAVNGTYTVSLSLTNNCGNSVSGGLVVNIGGGLLVSGELATSPPPFSTCSSVDFIAMGGSNYLFNFGDGNSLNTSSPTVSHTYATQGVYVASVVISNGCGNSATYTKSINVDGAGGPAVTLGSSVSPSCIGGSNGIASVNVSNGQTPYSYVWDNTSTQTTSSISGLSAGLHYVKVTDHVGCSNNFAVSISAPAPIVLASTTSKSACGIPTGTATVSVTSGGTAPYSYSWSNGSTSAVATGLGYGQYSIIVTDSKSCTSSANISVSENGGATLATNTITNVLCNGSSGGAININVTSGTPPYIYAWSNGATTQDITGVTAGTYSVLVTDGGSCVATYNAAVSQPAAIVVATAVTKAPTCGNFDGSDSTSATGGTAPYTYYWDMNPGSQTTQVATGLPAGSYSVTITDANGCTGMTVASLSNSNAPVLSSVITDVSCFGGSNGAINLSVAGGTSPYLYTWNVNPPQSNVQDISNVPAGNYFVSVNDSKGCLSFQFYTVSQPAVLTASVTNTGATCGNSDGTATATVAGGNSPYTYVWTGAQTTQTAVGLALGGYTVAVTDSKGCSASSTTSVTALANPIDICAITVDSTSTKNVIVWEKPVVTNVDSFKVYRLINSTYTHVGSVDYTALSEFTDNTNGVNPNITAYKYKITALDNCGNESMLSDFHQTIHLSVSVAAPPKSFNLSWNDYLGFPVTQYRIMVDSLNNGNWKARDSVSFGNPLVWSDIYHYPDTVNYMIEVDHPAGCVISLKGGPTPMASNLNLSKSNINRIQDTTLNPHVGIIVNELAVSLYPNPSSGIFTIDVKDLIKGGMIVKVFNVLGEEVKRIEQEGNKNKMTVDMSKQPKGVYYVQIASSGKLTTRKIIIE